MSSSWCNFKDCTDDGEWGSISSSCDLCELMYCEKHFLIVKYGSNHEYICISCISEGKFFEEPIYGYTYYYGETLDQVPINTLRQIRSTGPLITKRCPGHN